MDIDDSDVDDGDGDGDADANTSAFQRPQNRKELDEIRRNYSNKLEMACHYYQDPLLPLEFKAMYWASSAVMREYQSTLEAHKQGQDRTSTDCQFAKHN